MTIFEIVSLPKGNAGWSHSPVKPTVFYVVRQHSKLIEAIKSTVVDPLLLFVGDRILFDDEAELPFNLVELAKKSRSRPEYARQYKISKSEIPVDWQHASPTPEFIK